MQYIVLENWENLSSPQVVINESGETKIFDTLEEAQAEANDCQEGLVVPLGNVIDLLQRIYNTLETIEQEEGIKYRELDEIKEYLK